MFLFRFYYIKAPAPVNPTLLLYTYNTVSVINAKKVCFLFVFFLNIRNSEVMLNDCSQTGLQSVSSVKSLSFISDLINELNIDVH